MLWDDYNIEHIAKHGVKPAEVEQVVFGTGMKGPFEDNRSRTGRLVFFGFSGPTLNRRTLVAVTDRPTANGDAYVLSARPATDRERMKYMEE